MRPTKAVLLGCSRESEMGSMEKVWRYKSNGGNETVYRRTQTGKAIHKVTTLDAQFDANLIVIISIHAL